MSERTNLSRNTKGTFERCAVPAARFCSGGIGRRQKIEQQSVGLGGVAHGLIWQNELAQAFIEMRTGRHRPVSEARRFGIGIGVESRLRKSVIARPEPSAAHFVGIAFARPCGGQAGYAAGMERRGPPGE